MVMGCRRAQSCPTFCDHTDCSTPGSSVHGISQEEYQSGLLFHSPENTLQTCGIEPGSPSLAGQSFTTEPPGKLFHSVGMPKKQECRPSPYIEKFYCQLRDINQQTVVYHRLYLGNEINNIRRVPAITQIISYLIFKSQDIRSLNGSVQFFFQRTKILTFKDHQKSLRQMLYYSLIFSSPLWGT